ncbi:MAG: aldo/keto reductase [Mycobacterium sp.]
MTPIPTVTLSDDKTMPVLGISVTELSPEAAERTVTSALEAGYRLIDACGAEGIEEAVGRAIAASGVPREELFISTKLATEDQGFQSSQDTCKASLERFGLDYVDLYLVDWPAEQNGKYIDAWGGLMKAKEVGQTKSIGISNFNAEQLSDLVDLTYTVPAVHQLELHPKLNQADMRAVHAEKSITTQAYSPLADGALLADPTVVSVAAAHGKSPAQVLIRWNLQLGNAVITRGSDPAEIAESVDVFDFELTPAEVESITALGA